MQLCVLPKRGCGSVHPSERGRKAGVGHRSGSCSVMYTENLAIYVISVCDFNQRQSSGTTKITQHLLKKETERAGERDVERDANWNRVTAPASAAASGRSPSPASLPRRVSNFLAPGLGTVLCSLVWFGLVRCSTLIKEHHKSVARAIVIMNLISIRALILILQVLHYRCVCVCVCGLVWPFVCPMFLVIEFICIILSAQQHRI